MEKFIVGWKEWCSLPDLELPAIKAKLDTGAKTSCLHAFNITIFKEKRKEFANFYIHPIQNRKDIIKQCNAELIDQRIVIDSGAHKELRYIIKTKLILGNEEKEIEMSLTNRSKMSCRMLIGREALKGDFIVDSEQSFLLGKLSKLKIKKYYNILK
jgi:ribosomal protein S6--L-glutamate ligase